jgi:hypothetical protein
MTVNLFSLTPQDVQLPPPPVLPADYEKESLYLAIGEESATIQFSEEAQKLLREWKENPSPVSDNFYAREDVEPAVYRTIIPNHKTNEKLVKSLQGVSENVQRAAYSIIRKNLIPWNVGDLSEDQRQAAISLGMEKAKFLADNYLSQSAGSEFLDAMEMIAKFGMSGIKGDDGKMAYSIMWGKGTGIDDTNFNEFDLMKEKDPEAYQTYNALSAEGFRKRDVSIMHVAYQYLQGWIKRSDPQWKDDMVEQFLTWYGNTLATKVPDLFDGSSAEDIKSFREQIKAKNVKNKALDETWLEKDLNSFQKTLAYKSPAS